MGQKRKTSLDVAIGAQPQADEIFEAEFFERGPRGWEGCCVDRQP
jgi:hypothetical protein